jgi:hypothetical protein
MAERHLLPSITGRDDYILAKALIIAISHIQRLPPKKQAWSDMVDMCRIAHTFDPGSMGAYTADAYRITGFLVNLFPDDVTVDQTWKTTFEKVAKNMINQLP